MGLVKSQFRGSRREVVSVEQKENTLEQAIVSGGAVQCFLEKEGHAVLTQPVLASGTVEPKRVEWPLHLMSTWKKSGLLSVRPKC